MSAPLSAKDDAEAEEAARIIPSRLPFLRVACAGASERGEGPQGPGTAAFRDASINSVNNPRQK